MSGTMSVDFDLGNAAFSGESRTVEIARILRDLADKVEQGRTEGGVLDINGNKVGSWAYDDDESEDDGESEYCEACNERLEPSQIGLCDDCQETADVRPD